jgi:hypothetical protein
MYLIIPRSIGKKNLYSTREYCALLFRIVSRKTSICTLVEIPKSPSVQSLIKLGRDINRQLGFVDVAYSSHMKSRQDFISKNIDSDSA